MLVRHTSGVFFFWEQYAQIPIFSYTKYTTLHDKSQTKSPTSITGHPVALLLLTNTRQGSAKIPVEPCRARWYVILAWDEKVMLNLPNHFTALYLTKRIDPHILWQRLFQPDSRYRYLAEVFTLYTAGNNR